MASILTPEDVVRRIAAECTFTDERGADGIRLNRPSRSCANTASNLGGRPGEGKPPAKVAAVAVISSQRAA